MDSHSLGAQHNLGTDSLGFPQQMCPVDPNSTQLITASKKVAHKDTHVHKSTNAMQPNNGLSTPRHQRTILSKQPKIRKTSSTGSLLSLDSSTTLSPMDTYMRKSNVRHLNQSIHSQEESEGEASCCEVSKMVQLGEALSLGDSAFLESYVGVIQRHLDREKEDWQKQQ